MKEGYKNKQVYFVGGGIASLAGAVFLVRDCDFPGSNIHIMEEMKVLGGSNDGAGNSEQGYVIRGGRMLNDETYENTWDLLMSIPSIDSPMPFITAQFMPRARGDRPQVVPEGSTNLAFIGQFCEIPDHVVFTEEYSVRTARLAVYRLLGVNKPIAPIHQYQYDIRTLFQSFITSFR